MPKVLVRDIEQEILERLKRRARSNRRSLQAELKLILERAAASDMLEARELALKVRRMLRGRKQSDSAELVAEDRRR